MLLDDSWLARMRVASYLMLVVLVWGILWNASGWLRAQDTVGPRPEDAPMPMTPVEPTAAETAPAPPANSADKFRVFDESGQIQPVNFVIAGGWFMYLIVLASVLVVTITIERFISLRESKIIPPELVEGLGKISNAASGFDPREAFKLCQRFPSVTATIIQDMLIRVGRPHSEVEAAVQESSQREAERMYAYVRWLNLATAVTPMLGLLGTVWGMIMCFHGLTQLAPGGADKIKVLSEGIYVALITTVGGLIVAIPSSIFAHYFEGRIQSLMHQVQELISNLMPAIEPFEGRLRFGRLSQESKDAAGGEPRPVEAEKVEPKRPAAATAK